MTGVTAEVTGIYGAATGAPTLEAPTGTVASAIPFLSGIFNLPVGIVLRGLLPALPALAGTIGQVAAALGGGLVSVVPLFYALSTTLASTMQGRLALILGILILELVSFGRMWVAEVIPAVVDLWSAVLPLVATLLAGLIPAITSLA